MVPSLAMGPVLIGSSGSGSPLGGELSPHPANTPVIKSALNNIAYTRWCFGDFMSCSFPVENFFLKTLLLKAKSLNSFGRPNTCLFNACLFNFSGY